ncbi:hypothetical protein [Aquabacterium sp.]|uniref:hypothetical protein n=1 Tax=Aquabacterium sp. TaxID=1872578 RepID=UPI00261A70B0|nr:hypothetical protein [Aquabacterium sp.]MDD2975683.1 hypothetical protein [Aquabacterium sp.]
MNVVVQIEGRDAIPVRAIPMLTDWQALSPDVVAEILSGGSDHWPSFDGLTAYLLHPDGRVVRETQRAWSSWIVRNLKAASEAIKAKQTSHEAGYQQWRSEALAQLPAGVFVWRDEFEAAHLDEFGPDSERARLNPHTFQPATYALDYGPQYGPAESWQKLVLEGFEQLLTPAEPQSYLDLVTLRAIYDAATHDDHWLGLGSVSPRDAAYLLCGLDPIEVAKLRSEPNVPTIVVGETNNGRVQRLEERLCDTKKVPPAHRSWREWHAVAREIGADYHKGFDYFFDVLHRPSTDTVAVESTQVVTESASNTTKKPRNVMKKKAFIDEVLHEWPTVEADIGEASRNGLKVEAHAGKHAEWDVDLARQWAKKNSKLKTAQAERHPHTYWPGGVIRHTLKD